MADVMHLVVPMDRTSLCVVAKTRGPHLRPGKAEWGTSRPELVTCAACAKAIEQGWRTPHVPDDETASAIVERLLKVDAPLAR